MIMQATKISDAVPRMTPAKRSFDLPTQALARAVAEEWIGKRSFNPATMPLTALAYTAIDRVSENREAIIEVLLAYVDTDTLCYRSINNEALQTRQKARWDPILAWSGNQFSALWQTTSGVMPIVQSDALHGAIKGYLLKLSDMQLAGVSLLASLLSSLVLALAVFENRLSLKEAFALSRLEEQFQAEEWGEDSEAKRREEVIFKEVRGVASFLNLLGDEQTR